MHRIVPAFALAAALGGAAHRGAAQQPEAGRPHRGWAVLPTDRLRVWIDPTPAVSGWNVSDPSAVRSAFEEWKRVGVVGFAFVADSAGADIRVLWVSRFDEPGDAMAGRTHCVRDARDRIVAADIELALHHRGGARLTDAEMRALSLHEIGHALGLEHVHGRGRVMSPTVRVRRLSRADLAEARRLYPRAGTQRLANE